MPSFKIITAFIFTVVVVPGFVVLVNNFLSDVPPVPLPKEDEWWGRGERQRTDEAVVPYTINISDSDLIDLNDRLDKFLTRPHTPPLEKQGFRYGFNSNFLKQIVKYWKNDYDWRKRETYLNQYPQFKTRINGLEIHFLKASPKTTVGKKKIPLLLLHGWPGSVREFYELIPFLTTPRKDAGFVFEVVVPSLPGYGFSEGAAKPGFGPPQIAAVMKKLMVRLKHDKFVVVGGDWGSLIGKIMGQSYPDRVLGFHSTMCMVNTPLSNIKLFLGSFYPPLIVEERFRDKLYPLKNFFYNITSEMGYFVLQATKPDTVGTALSDTPAGLAAYILEKFSTWTNTAWKGLPDGGLTKKYSLDSLLDNVMIYWFSNSITTSQRLYSEAFNADAQAFDRIPIRVPTACARFENELLWQPTSFLKEQYLNLLQVNDLRDGGHFAAFEEPRRFSEDVWEAVKKFLAYHQTGNKTPKL